MIAEYALAKGLFLQVFFQCAQSQVYQITTSVAIVSPGTKESLGGYEARPYASKHERITLDMVYPVKHVSSGGHLTGTPTERVDCRIPSWC